MNRPEGTREPPAGPEGAAAGRKDASSPDPGPAGTEHHIRVLRTARFRVLGDPADAEEVWFVLHGYGQLAERFVRRFGGLPGVAPGRRAVVAPEALSRFYVEDEGIGPHGPGSTVGATWMTRADRENEIRDYVEYLDRVAARALDPARAPGAGSPIDGGARRVVVLGFSQGAATASRWVTYGRIRPSQLVLWGGGLAVDLDDERARLALAGVQVRFVVGRTDGWADGRAEESARRLASCGIATQRIDFDGGHRVEAAVLSRHWPA